MEEKRKRSPLRNIHAKSPKKDADLHPGCHRFCCGRCTFSFALAGRWSTIFGWVGLGHFSQTAKDVTISLHVLDVEKADAMVVSCQDKNYSY